MEGRRFHSGEIFFLFSACVVFTFGQSTDSTCFKPEADSYVVPTGYFLTARFSILSFSDPCPNLVIVRTKLKGAPNKDAKPLCQISLTSDGSGNSKECSYNSSSKTFIGKVAFHEIGERNLTITGVKHNAPPFEPQPNASIAITVISATECDFCPDQQMCGGWTMDSLHKVLLVLVTVTVAALGVSFYISCLLKRRLTGGIFTLRSGAEGRKGKAAAATESDEVKYVPDVLPTQARAQRQFQLATINRESKGVYMEIDTEYDHANPSARPPMSVQQLARREMYDRCEPYVNAVSPRTGRY